MMADRVALASLHCVYVNTSLDTHLLVPLHDNDGVNDFKEMLCTEHRRCFPEHGCINVSALKVFRGENFYHVANSMTIIRLFDGINDDWVIYADVVRADESEVVTLMAPNNNFSNETKSDLERHVHGHTRDHALEVKDKPIFEEALDAEVNKRKTKKRKLKNMDANKSCKKSSRDVDQSAVLATTSKLVVDERNVVCGNAQVDVASESSAIPPGEKLDDVMGVIREENKRGKKNDISIGMNGQTSDEDRLCQEKIVAINPGLVDGHTKGEEKDVQCKQPLEEAIETESATKVTKKRKSTSSIDSNGSKGKLDDLTGAIEPGMGSRQTIPDNQLTATLDRQYQEKDLAPTIEFVDGRTGDEVKDVQNHPIIEEVMVTDLTIKKTKKKKMRSLSAKKSSNDLNQSVIATSTSRARVEENQKLCGEAQVDVPSEPSAILLREEVNDFLKGAKEKDNESSKKTPDSGGSRQDSNAADKLQTDALVTSPANDLEAGSGLTATPAPEKKKKRRKSSKNHTKVTGSVDLPEATQNESEMGEKVVENVESREDIVKAAGTFELANNVLVADLASIPHTLVQEVKTLDHSLDESRTCEHKVVEGHCEADGNEALSVKSKKKTTKKAKIKAKDTSVPSSGQVVECYGVGAATVEPIKVVDGQGPDNVIRNVLDSLQQNKETQESLDTIGKKSSKKSKKKSTLIMVKDQVLSVEDKNAAQEEAPLINNRNESDASWTLLKNGIPQSGEIINNDIFTESDPHLKKKLEVADNTEDNPSQQIELPHGKEKADIGDNFGDGTKQDHVLDGADANEALSVKSNKKTTKKAKIKAKDTSVPSSGQVVECYGVVAATVEPIKVVDGQGPDNVIRNVLDSLQQSKETQESLDTIGKKSSKKSKKKSTLNMVKDQVLSVEDKNAAQEEAPLINNRNESDASLTPLKNGIPQSGEIINNDIFTESDPHLKKKLQVADNTEDNPSQQIKLPHGKEKADIGDNFGDGTKQYQVLDGAKTKKEKKGRDLHPGGSMDGSRSSMKPKERKGSSMRVQPASSGTSQLPAVVKNDSVVSRSKNRDGSRIDHSNASLKGTIHDKEAVTSKKNLFKNTANWNIDEDESKLSGASTKPPSGVLSDNSDDDSDGTSMARKQGNHLFSRERAGGANKFLGSSGNIKLQDILRSSSSYKKAKLTASQSPPDMLDDESLALDCVPDSQAK